MQETQKRLWAPGFGLAQLRNMQSLWVWINEWKIFLSLLLSAYLLSNKNKINFLKIYFLIIFLLERRIYTEERQRGRSSVRWFTPQVSTMADTMLIRSQEPLPGLPRGCRVPKLWAILNCFPGPQAVSWKGSWAATIELAPIWDLGRARRGS